VIQPPPPYNLRPMQVSDIPQVMAIENESFPTPWPAYAYKKELTHSDRSHCYVLEIAARKLLGYGCFWLLVNKAHISTLAIAWPWRGRGLGELLLITLIHEAIIHNAPLITLQVRVSNRPAQALYAKYGLQVIGQCKRYYANNQEDAWIMAAKLLDVAYQARLTQLQVALWQRLSATRSVLLPATGETYE